MDNSFFAPVVGTPTRITTHKTYNSDTGEWTESPDVPWAQLKFETMADKKDEIEKIFKPYEGKISPGRLNNIRYKLYAVRHAKDLYVEEESIEETKLLSGVAPGLGVEFTEANVKALYLIEAFLFQVKSTLDILALVLNNLSISSTITGFHNKGVDLIKDLNKEGTRFGALVTLIESEEKWIDTLVTERNKIAHSNSIKALWFVQKLFTGGTQVEVEYPKMPNGQRAKEYIEETETNLLSFVEKFLANLGL